MSRMKLYLLGPPRVELDEILIEVKPRKALALLIYLACKGERQSRDALATLLWPDSDQRQARAALRRRLSELNSSLPGDWLLSDRETVGLKPVEGIWLDVSQFQEALAACQTHGHPPNEACPDCLEPLTRAVSLYRNDFLSGFTLADCPEFDEWQFFQAEELRQQLASALERLINLYSHQGNPEAVLPHARRRLALDPMHEPAHQALMRLYVQAGQQAAALRQYDLCVQTLEDELGLPPSEETTALYEQVRRSEKELLADREDSVLPEAQEPALADFTPTPTFTPPGPEDEIRLMTVLFADMSRSVELTWDLQPEETADLVNQLLQTMLEILAVYEARIDRFLGDGLLAIFGVPQTHEDDPERAIRAALAMQTAAEALDLALTVGINTGPVYFGRIGSHIHRETTVMGPVVNLASRLQARAEAGQTLVGQTTYQQTRRAFRFQPLSLTLKGIPQPLPAYRVERPRRRAAKARGIEGLGADLIGRDEELTKLQTILTHVRQGQGQMVSLIGEAGVGKSRLVHEFRIPNSEFRMEEGEPDTSIAARSSEFLWLEGRCLEMSQATSYGPFVDLLRRYFAWGPDDDEPSRAGRVVVVLQEMRDRGALSADQFDELGPLLGNLLSLRFGSDWDDRLQHAGPEQIRHRTFQVLYDFFMALSQQGPLLLILEDLHWADSLSLDLIAHLMEGLAEAPLLLLCVYRPERDHKCWRLATIASRKCLERFTELRLRELTPHQSRQLVESLLVIENLPPSTKDLILSRAQGNPFFVEEVIRSLIDAGLVYRQGQTWHASDEIETVTVPETVQAVIQSRVDRLEPALKQVLQWASVMGRLFQPRVLAQVIPTAIDLAETLWRLEDQALLYQEETVPEEVYAFKHVLTQEAIYQTLLRRQRAQYHRQVAETIERLYQGSLAARYEQLAYHYDQGDALEQAVDYLLKAGEKARRAYLNAEAIAYFERAKEKLKDLPPTEAHQSWRYDALKGLGQVNTTTSNFAEAEVYLREAIALGREIGLPPRQLARLHCWLGDLLLNYQQRHRESRPVVEAGLALLADDSESAEAAMLKAVLAYTYQQRGDIDRFCDLGLQIAQVAEQLPYSEELRIAFGVVWETFIFSRDMQGAIRWGRFKKERETENYDLVGLAETILFPGGQVMTWVEGRRQAGLERCQQARELFRKAGDRKRENWAQMLMSWIHLAQGNLLKAEQIAVEALAKTETHNSQFLPDTYHCLAISYLAQNRPEQAQEAIQTAFELAIEVQDLTLTNLLISQGHICLWQGKQTEAAKHFEAAAVAGANPKPIFRKITDIYLKPPHFVDALSGLEAAYGAPDAFHAFCQNFRELHPEMPPTSPKQWYLEPAQIDPWLTIPDFGQASKAPEAPLIETHPPQSLKWTDLVGDCTLTVQDGVEIQTPNGRDMWYLNWRAPRLLRPMSGDFALQTVCLPAAADKPAIGGLLFWKDKNNFLCLERGRRGPTEIRLSGCLAKNDVVIGRGHLCLDNPPERVYLRLERVGQWVKALCSPDGESWFSVGQVEFPVEDPFEVGLYASSMIDRTVYPGAFAEGTAVRFEAFQVWSK